MGGHTQVLQPGCQGPRGDADICKSPDPAWRLGTWSQIALPFHGSIMVWKWVLRMIAYRVKPLPATEGCCGGADVKGNIVRVLHKGIFTQIPCQDPLPRAKHQEGVICTGGIS